MSGFDDSAWPLADRLIGRARHWWRLHPMIPWLLRKETFDAYRPLEVEPDHISAWVVQRNAFEETYARPVRAMKPDEYPSDLEDRITSDLMPQFTLRNLDRAEKDVYLEDPLELRRIKGIGGEIHSALSESRDAKLAKVSFQSVWTLDLVTRLRETFRRILQEEPWELRFGREIRDTLQRPLWRYFPEGVHADDMPGVVLGPVPVPPPAEWVAAPYGEPEYERPVLPGETVERE